MQLDVMPFKDFQQAVQVKQLPSESIHAVNNHAINLSCVNFLQQLLQCRSFERFT